MLNAFWDWLGQNAAQIVALLALIVAVGSFWVQRKHNRLSVKPHLTTFTEREHDKKRAVVWLRNNGLGPALITSYEFLLDGKTKSGGSPYKADELIAELLKGIACRSKRTQLGVDYSMPANASVVVLDVELDPAESVSLTEIQKRFERSDLIVRYESFYGEPFVLDTSNDPPSNLPSQATPGGAPER